MALSPIRGGSTGVKLFRSIVKGDLDVVKSLFQRRGRALLSLFGMDGCTPFLLACKKGQLAVAQFLLEQGASLSDRDKDSKRQGLAIHYACWGGHAATILWLLGLGASLDDIDIVGNTPLLYAIYGGHKAVVEELLRRGRSLRERNLKSHSAILQVRFLLAIDHRAQQCIFGFYFSVLN
jgi:ankyrin repeat protein